MNRDEALAATRSIRGHLEVLEAVLIDPATGGRTLELEVLSRANDIDSKLAQLRWAVLSGWERADSNVHHLGDRPDRKPAA